MPSEPRHHRREIVHQARFYAQLGGEVGVLMRRIHRLADEELQVRAAFNEDLRKLRRAVRVVKLGDHPWYRGTVYFKANQADALTAAFKEFTRKDLTRSTRPSLLSQLHKFKELAQALGRDRVKNKEHGGPER